MREILIIVRREFKERVQTRAFLISTILGPLLMAGLFILPAAVGGGRGSEKRIVLVDETPEHLGERFTTILETRPESQNENSYVVERVSGSYDAAARLRRRR
jgi:ABC-2 type transport system permease protein